MSVRVVEKRDWHGPYMSIRSGGCYVRVSSGRYEIETGVIGAVTDIPHLIEALSKAEQLLKEAS